MSAAYLVQFGLMSNIGRFSSAHADFVRGDTVVVRSSRGTELGRILAEATIEIPQPNTRSILRSALPEDIASARRAETARHRRFEECRRIFDDGLWPIEPVDFEPLLDEGRAVLYYLGPHRLDVSGLRAAVLESRGIDLVFEPVGRDAPDLAPEPVDDHGCGSCSSHGGCGSNSESGSGCGTSSGCSGCAVAPLVSNRRP